MGLLFRREGLFIMLVNVQCIQVTWFQTEWSVFVWAVLNPRFCDSLLNLFSSVMYLQLFRKRCYICPLITTHVRVTWTTTTRVIRSSLNLSTYSLTLFMIMYLLPYGKHVSSSFDFLWLQNWIKDCRFLVHLINGEILLKVSENYRSSKDNYVKTNLVKVAEDAYCLCFACCQSLE
jgi:hypothetical protein